MEALICFLAGMAVTLMLTKGGLNIRIIHKTEHPEKPNEDLTVEDRKTDDLLGNMPTILNDIGKLMGGGKANE